LLFFASLVLTSLLLIRLIYFRGHKREENSAMITKVAMNYETFSSLLKGQTEFATRTLSNLYNLATVRGALAADGALDIEASMSGPHAYYGYLDPRDAHTVSFDSEGNPQLVKFPHSEEAKKIGVPIRSLLTFPLPFFVLRS